MELEDLGEQLYNLLAQVLNRPENRAFFDSIRAVSYTHLTLPTILSV